MNENVNSEKVFQMPFTLPLWCRQLDMYILGQWTAIYDGHCYVSPLTKLQMCCCHYFLCIIWCHFVLKTLTFWKGNEISIQHMKTYLIFTSGPHSNVYFYVLHKTENAKFSDSTNNIFSECHIEFWVSVNTEKKRF